jgi:hypothetical protein
LVGELSHARGQAVELGQCLRRDDFPSLRRAEVDADLSAGEVGRLGRFLRLLGRGDDDDRRCDAEGEGDRGESRSGTGLVANEVRSASRGAMESRPAKAEKMRIAGGPRRRQPTIVATIPAMMSGGLSRLESASEAMPTAINAAAAIAA